jgi:hypothetical protein
VEERDNDFSNSGNFVPDSLGHRHSFCAITTDFDRSIGLADQGGQPELKLHMKLLAIQAVTSE